MADDEHDQAGCRLEAGRPDLHRHLLRDGRGHRQDHDLPARGPQRLPAPDPVRAPRRLRGRPRRSGDRRDRPHRPGRRSVLLGRRPAGARRRRLPRRARHRAAQRARSPGADPPVPEAGRRDGRGLRDRRRPRAAHRVRPHDRGRQRALRPDRPAGRLVRRRLRLGPARAQRRAEEGARSGSCAASTTRARRSTWGS